MCVGDYVRLRRAVPRCCLNSRAAVVFTGVKGAILAATGADLGNRGFAMLPSVVCASPVGRSTSVREENLTGMLPDACV